ncbi:MAG: CRISPR-associated endonuclease Cas1 [Bifidobacteriaceae bacterium]|nr:CRISPR-associated endonuclease Cas1 [Bifidobacteriaceae bacterium]
MDEQRIKQPTRHTVYVARQDSLVYSQKGRLVVDSKSKGRLLDVPSSHVARLVCFGSVSVSAGVRSWALMNGIDVLFLSRKGSYLGQLLAGHAPGRIDRLRAQLAAADDPDRSLAFARQVVLAKTRHQIKVLQRFSVRAAAAETAPRVEAMRGLCDAVKTAESVPVAMGIEGAAAKEYFAALALLVPEDMAFDGRSRRPPLDLFNAALSYAYAILLGECTSALVAAGLDPQIGMLHAKQARRQSLALDLMEEFRPLAVDQVVIRLCRRGSLKASHGAASTAEGGIFLNKEGKGILIDGYEKRMLQATSGALQGFSGTLRRHVFRQAELLAAFIDGRRQTWTGLSWR